ncbi:TonB-dependent receptor [Ravibacter arvi]|uniref:TonB-dependent receptor n=1 Tax=Ravibacter arvi TaxID=2051041 RepID=A0ABP8M0R1_9BACT
MKIGLFPLFLAVILIGVVKAESLSGQNLLSQRITINQENSDLGEILRAIEKQSGVRFVYSPQVIPVRHIMSITMKHATLSEVLDKLLKPVEVTYEVSGGHIVLDKIARPAEDPDPGQAVPLPERVIKGTVKDEKGEPLPGVNIMLKGTQRGAVSDVSGNFELEIPDSGGNLVFSFVGYLNQELAIGNQAQLDIRMEVDQKALEEVVVIGYGTQKKVNLTGSVDVISGDRLANRPANNVADLIKGASPNLNITMGMRGGEPGATATWNIRGAGSLHGSGSPLVLVDGVEMNINNVDPESIESISVLKDASASAIYGSRAPFGVILITTKKGARGDKVNIQYTTNLALSSPVRVPSQVNSLTWATAFNQANANAGLAPVYGDAQMDRIRGYLDGSYKTEYDPNNPPNTIWAGRQQGNANNNWPQLLMKDFAFNQKHNINVSGGNDKTQYYVSGGFIDQDGVYAYGYDYYKRYNFLTNFNTTITKWLKFNSSVKYATGKTDYPVGQTTVTRDNFFVAALQFAPVMPLYNVNGTIQHPIVRWSQGTGRDKTEVNDFFITLGSEIEPVKGWKTNLTYNYNGIGSSNTANPKPVWVEVGTGAQGNIGKPSTGYNTSFSKNTYRLINAVTSYEKIVGGHYFKPMVGFEQEERYFSGVSATGVNLITEEVPSLRTSLGEKTVNDEIYHWATRGVFGRLNYNYREKYLLEFSARYNGSSRFAKESRWGFFPSASAGYNISQEDFWQPLERYVKMLKLRASYGALGNQNVNNYLYLSTIPVYNELSWIIDQERPAYATAPALISDNLTWETITTLNLGFDAGFLNNRLTLSFDWFRRKTTNMLGPSVTLPYQLGAATPQTNNAELLTKGFELLVGWEDRLSSSFSYDVKIGLGDNTSTILKYKNDKGLIDTWYAGKKYGEIWGYETGGLIQTEGEPMADQSRFHPKWGPGDMKYIDLDGDNKITDGTRTLDDHGDLKVVGNYMPRYNIGVNAGLRWKNLDFSMFWQGIGRRDYSPDNNSMLFWGLTGAWGSSAVFEDSESLNYWRPAGETNLLGPNTDAYFAKPYFTAETLKNRQVQSKYIMNAAYLRLKNLQIGYSVPANLLKKLLIQQTRVYLSGENLLLISGMPKVFDPETAFASDPKYGGYSSSGVIYPLFRSLSVGLNLTF